MSMIGPNGAVDIKVLPYAKILCVFASLFLRVEKFKLLKI